jgi:hypothetical protein
MFNIARTNTSRATRLFIRIALLLLICIEFPSHANAHTFGDSIGINVKFSQGEPLSDLPLLKELGVRWVRDSVDWRTMEPVAGRYIPFPESFRQRLVFYKQNNIGVVFGLWYDNTVAYPNSTAQPFHSADADAYGNYAAEIARQLKQSGVRFVIELYNEPHNSLKWLGGNWNGKPPAAWLDQYVRMVTSATSRVKALDPTIRLFANDDMWIIQYWYLEKGLPAQLDGLSVHPYVKNWPEIAAVAQDTDWVRPFDVVDADRSFTSCVRRLRDHAADKLGHTPAIWVTEWGWSIGDTVADAPMTQDILAGLLPRAFITSADAGVEVLCWFSIQDNVDGPMGLTDNKGNHRKTFAALARLSTELAPATAMHHVLGQDHPACGVQVYRFDLPTGNKLVAWNIDGTSDAILSNATGTHLRDVFGKAVEMEAGHRVQLSRSPLYIDCPPDALLAPQTATGKTPVYLFP